MGEQAAQASAVVMRRWQDANDRDLDVFSNVNGAPHAAIHRLQAQGGHDAHEQAQHLSLIHI